MTRLTIQKLAPSIEAKLKKCTAQHDSFVKFQRKRSMFFTSLHSNKKVIFLKPKPTFLLSISALKTKFEKATDRNFKMLVK